MNKEKIEHNKIVSVKTEQGYDFKMLIDVLKENLTEANIAFIGDTDTKKTSGTDTDNQVKKKNPGGIRIVALDEHQTLIIYVKLNSVNFVEYYTKFPIYNAGLDLRELHKFMKNVDKDSIMTISIDKDDEQLIEFNLQNTVKGTNTTYKQKLMDIDDNSKQIPQETNFEITVKIDTQDFRTTCSQMSQYSEFVEIICTKNEITFKCLGDQNEYVKTFTNNENGCVQILCTNDNGKKPIIVQAIYNLKHLLTFGKCVNLCNDMQLYLKNDYPLFINYTVGSLGKMLVGLTAFDIKAIKQSNDRNDRYYNVRK
ncbi:putative proliferating cell nuclear antigen [Bodo saltans virus]|jgi:proliferating cell nuclear antigen PCNA|uniref:Proliferating cell nuclear antigen n=1 Tax=Bodo saltans virus TaxID=2024608 RepID=A0A2H4UUG6_9VIRU|nr:putative proliferating cell nuclear antigen [Bodo saltans virus]ATZ80514.1 putative proliferating cell nuclear antigen [Bodo saltans virus]